MSESRFKNELQERKIFKIGRSFLFAVQVPDDSVGISGSRCSNCDNEVAYCHQRCRHCGFPFVGPFGFPQFSKWKALSSDEKRAIVEDIYAHDANMGRLVYVNVKHVPLTPCELREIERLTGHNADLFLSAHSVSPQEIKNTLFE